MDGGAGKWARRRRPHLYEICVREISGNFLKDDAIKSLALERVLLQSRRQPGS